MKILILISLFASPIFADYLDRECSKSNITVKLDLYEIYASPKFVFAREGDIVCFKITNYIENSVSFSVEKMPLTDSLKSGFSKNYSLRFPKIGEYSFKIRGSSILENPKIIILDKASFENLEKDEYLKNSIRNHR